MFCLSFCWDVSYAVPNLFSSGSDHQARSGVMSWLPGDAINLGLDLQGGSHLLLRADLPAVQEERLTGVAEQLRLALRDERIQFRGLKAAPETVIFSLRKLDDKAKLQSIFNELGREFQVVNEEFGFYSQLYRRWVAITCR